MRSNQCLDIWNNEDDNLKNNNFNIDFKPMISELKPENLEHIEYTADLIWFKDCPQWFLIWVDKLKFVFAGMVVLGYVSAFLLDKVFNMPWLADPINIFMVILSMITVCSFYMGVHTNGGNMRQKEFNKYNDDNIFWSPMDLDYDTREYFNIPNVIGAITSRYVAFDSVTNVLAFRDSRLSIGDIEYETRENSIGDSDSSYRYERHRCPYSASPIDANLPSMKLTRKKWDYIHTSRLFAIKMPDGSLADLIIKKISRKIRREIRRGPDEKDKIVGALQKNDLGVKIEKWFSRYPEVAGVDIFPDMFVIYWGSEIPGDFNSVEALPETVISTYETRLAGTLDFKSILEV